MGQAAPAPTPAAPPQAARQAVDKTTTMQDAIDTHVHHGSVVCLEGFTHLIPTAAGH